MYKMQEVKRNLLGCFEIFLFMKKGIKRFDSSKISAVKSFLIPLVLLPFTLLAIAAVQNETPLNSLIGMHIGHLVITACLFIGFVYFFTKQYGREQYFWRFITILNWISIFSVLFACPLLIGRFLGIGLKCCNLYT